MAIPTSRESLAQYCLAKLGNGAVDIAITEQQLSDRIDDAIQFYQEFNYDGVERLYWQHIITGNTLGVVNAAVFSQPEQITGLTSGATVALINLATDTTLTVGVPVGTFSIGETIVGQESGATAVVTAWTNGDISNRYVTCPDYIQAVTNIFPFGASSNTNNVFDIRFQLKLSDIYALQTANLSQYVQIQFHLGLIEDEFNPKSGFRYNRKMNQIHIDTNWEENIIVGQYLTFDCYSVVDPDTWPTVYNDMSLKRLATAYIKRNWGNNVKLYSGVQLPGGITVNGQQIYNEAITECDEAEKYMRDTYELPAMGIIG